MKTTLFTTSATYISHSKTYTVLSCLNRYHNIIKIGYILLFLLLNLIVVITALQPVLVVPVILPTLCYSCSFGKDYCTSNIDIDQSWSQQTQRKGYCRYFPSTTMKRTKINSKVGGSEPDVTSQQQQPQPQSNGNNADESLSLLPVSKRMKLMSTLRNFVSSSMIPIDLTKSYQERKENAIQNLQLDIVSIQDQIRNMVPFSTDEKLMITNSLLNVIPNIESDNTNSKSSMSRMIEQLKNNILSNYAHLSHKNWTNTDENSKKWHEYLYPFSSYITQTKPTNTTKHDNSRSSSVSISSNDINDNTIQRHMFERIYREGNWDGAVQHQIQVQQQQQQQQNSNNAKQNKPWAVLVTVRFY
jgi:hypothetical protein